MTCFVSRPSGITLVKFHSFQVTKETNILAESKGQKKRPAIICDPGSELRRGRRERRAKTVNGMEKKRYNYRTAHHFDLIT